MRRASLILCIFSLLLISENLYSQTYEGISAPKPVKLRKAPTLPPSIQAKVNFFEPSGNGYLDAEEKAYFQITAKNLGQGKAFDLQVNIEPNEIRNLLYSSSLLIGDIPPGEEKIVQIPVQAAFQVESKQQSFTFSFEEANGFEPARTRVTFNTKEFAPPDLQVAEGVNIEDANNNGMIEPGELVKITARIQNLGKGIAKGVHASLKIGQNVFLAADAESEFDLGNLSPSDHKDITFSIYTNMRAKDLPLFIDLSEHYGKFGKQNIQLSLAFNRPVTKMQELVIQGRELNPSSTISVSGFEIDVDQNIPKGRVKNADAVAVVIGISRYKNVDVPSVDFAKRDATVMKQYLTNQFGFDERRIIYADDENAALTDFKRIFEEQLANYVQEGKSDVFIYYSGHGVPDPETKEAYFVPYDCNPNYAKSTGYKLSEFYERLSTLKARTVTVVIDACFSGASEKGMLLKNISPVFIRFRSPIAGIDNGIVFTSSTGQQVSTWYHNKKHGLFTYFFLKGLRGDADKNGDKQVTVEEMENYLTLTVPGQARYLSNREQTPQVIARNKERVLVRY